jgi:hypothetical protein
MTSKERVLASLNHKPTDKIPIDLGSTGVTGIHILMIEKIRNHFDLEWKPIKVIEPFQMLGEVDEELKSIMGVDITGIFSRKNMFGIPQDEGWKEFKTFWGQEILVPEKFNTTNGDNGSLLIYPEGDTNVPPCAKMPSSGYFFDAISRQNPIDEKSLNVEDNLEEFGIISDIDLSYWKGQFDEVRNSGKGVIAGFGGTAIGDIALVPGLNLKHPKGIRDVEEWYISTVLRKDYLHQIFEKQTDIALINLKKIWEAGGEIVDAVFVCGADLGTQISTFCSIETFEELYAPYYRKLNKWIHENTTWKSFKHSCGAIEPLISKFIECGFDILNPVQISAAGMEPKNLKQKYGDRITFWGGVLIRKKFLLSEHLRRLKIRLKEIVKYWANKEVLFLIPFTTYRQMCQY